MSLFTKFGIISSSGASELTYKGLGTAGTVARYSAYGESNNSYALIAGGYTSTAVDAYNVNLVRTSATALTTSPSDGASCHVGEYVLIGGGDGSVKGGTLAVTSYNNSLVKGTAPNLNGSTTYPASSGLVGVSMPNYGLIAGGYNGWDGILIYDSVSAYNSSLVKSTPTVLTEGVNDASGASVGEYGIIAGGSANSGYTATVNAYNASLVKSSPTSLASGRYRVAGVSHTKYALFGGGYSSGGNYTAVVDAYNESLVRSNPTYLSSPRIVGGAGCVDGFAVFVGGDTGTTRFNTVDVYDENLVRTTPFTLSEAKDCIACTTIGFTLLVGAGRNDSNVGVATVEIIGT